MREPNEFLAVPSLLCISNRLIGRYQCGFRFGKYTINQIFTIRQILEKSLAKQIDTNLLFIVFETAFDSTDSCLFDAMSKFGIPAKIIRLSTAIHPL